MVSGGGSGACKCTEGVGWSWCGWSRAGQCIGGEEGEGTVRRTVKECIRGVVESAVWGKGGVEEEVEWIEQGWVVYWCIE